MTESRVSRLFLPLFLALALVGLATGWLVAISASPVVVPLAWFLAGLANEIKLFHSSLQNYTVELRYASGSVL